jgi:hypothetical protein
VLRDRVPLLRDLPPVPAADFAREVGAVEDLLAPLERFAPVPDDFARVVPDLRAPAPMDFLADADDLERVPADLRPLREEVDAEPPPPLDDSSDAHLPDSTRCAASATASAISEPSLVALDITLVAAWVAVSAASSPASRIARRAFGLALIAAAAAASPAASISLLIAALASLSTVSFPELEEEPEELLREDLAIASLPCWRKDTLMP